MSRLERIGSQKNPASLGGVGVRWGLANWQKHQMLEKYRGVFQTDIIPVGTNSCPNPVPLASRNLGQTNVFSSFESCTATVETVGPTGVEMEALTAVQVALLTIYDMCKAVDRGMTMNGITLREKHGGKSGSFVNAT